MQGNLAVSAVPAVVDDQMTVAGRQADVVDVQTGGLADTSARVEGGVGDGLVAQRGAVGLAEQAELVTSVQCPRGGRGEVGAFGGGGAEPAAAVEVIDGGQVRVDGGGLALDDRLQVGAVVAGGPVAGVGIGERVTLDRVVVEGGGEPGQVLADPGEIDADRIGIQPAARLGDAALVLGEHRLQALGKRGRPGARPPSPRCRSAAVPLRGIGGLSRGLRSRGARSIGTHPSRLLQIFRNIGSSWGRVKTSGNDDIPILRLTRHTGSTP